ncbi:hypothetical protein BKA81DRAFT_397245 [Phyllosticta paracitricarpa]|uniref:Uncharacterized protein n=1 Tax=Phyllosticta citricarpa TaxID=55181 RepID=A0ABR1MBZ2_9PEZI
MGINPTCACVSSASTPKGARGCRRHTQILELCTSATSAPTPRQLPTQPCHHLEQSYMYFMPPHVSRQEPEAPEQRQETQVHASQQELLGRLHAENKKADDLLRRARELEAETHAYLDKIRSSRESDTAAREPGRCYCDVEWPDASPEMLRCLHKIDDLVSVKFRPDDVGFFRHLPAPDGEDDDENEVFYRYENRSCGKCGGAINKVSGPWSRVEVFSLVSHTILAKAVAGVMDPNCRP